MAQTETQIPRTKLIAELMRSPHGKLEEYLPVGQRAAREDPEFFAHLVAYDAIKGQVRDAHVALPVVCLSTGAYQIDAIRENALAHLAKLDPRNLVRALDFAHSKTNGHGRALKRLVERYLRAREENWSWWERSALQHRESMRTLYNRFHVKPGKAEFNIVLHGRVAKGAPRVPPPPGSLFAVVRDLSKMSAREAAGTIIERKIPFLIAMGALGKNAKDSDLVLAMIERMTPTELVTNTKMLEKLGMKTNPALRAAYQEALGRASVSTKTSFKASRAAEAVADEGTKAKLHGLQEKQIQALGGVDGDWLVLGDKSGSMALAIETARHVAATLAKVVKGQVHLVFFNDSVRYIDATGKDYDALKKETSLITAGGATSIGVGLQYAVEKGFNIDGIAIISDAEENTAPAFATEYSRFVRHNEGKTPPVYLFKVGAGAEHEAAMKARYGSNWRVISGARDTLTPTMQAAGHDVQVFDLTAGVDYYALPAVVNGLRANRFSLIDDIMAAPLLTLDQVFAQRINP